MLGPRVAREVRRRGVLRRAGRAAVAGGRGGAVGGGLGVRGHDVLDERLRRVQVRPAVVAVPGRHPCSKAGQ